MVLENKLSSDLIARVEKVDTAAKLGVPLGELGARVKLTIRDTKTGEVEMEKEFISHSFVKQFLQFLWIMCEGLSNTLTSADFLAMRDVLNALHYDISVGSGIFDAAAAINIDTYGILVGTNNAAPTITDYNISTKIAHGVGAGQLQYSAVVFGAPSDDGVTSQYTVTRDFANGSGNSITVKEIALVVKLSTYYYLIVHDATGDVPVANGKTLTVNYQIEANV